MTSSRSLIFLILFFTLLFQALPAFAETPNQMDLEFKGTWQYQWGDSPKDEYGNLIRLKDPLNAPGWLTASTMNEVVGRNQNDVIWLRTLIPKMDCEQCSVYVQYIDQVYEVYVDDQLIASNGIIQQGFPVAYTGSNLNLFSYSQVIQGKETDSAHLLTFRVQSDRNTIGLLGKILMGENREIVRHLQQDSWFSIFTGLFCVAIGLAMTILAMINYEKPIYGSFAAFALTYGSYTVASHREVQILYENPLLFGYLDLITLQLVPVFLFLFMEHLFGKGKWQIHRIAWMSHLILGITSFLLVYLGVISAHQTILPVQMVSIVTILSVFTLLIVDFRKWNPETKHFLIGIGLFLFSGVHDAIQSMNLLPYQFPLRYLGGMALLVTQLVIIALRNRVITEKLMTENASLEHHTQFLENQLSHLQEHTAIFEQKTAELRKKNDELLNLNESKDRILANTSHELRTPINGIIGIAESMIDQAPENFDPDQRRNLRMIITSGRRLSNLVNDILDFSRLRKNDLTLRIGRVDVLLVSNLVLDLCKPLVGKKNIQLKNDIPTDFPVIKADENRLNQILYNLLSNAIKFTQNGEIVIQGDVHGDMVYITVRDSGMGIPKEKHSKIFEAFEQVDGNIPRVYGGTGLGLAVTKQLVELHGGKITVDSVENEYTAMTFTMPIERETNVQSLIREEDQIGNRIKESDDDFNEDFISVEDTTGEYNLLIVDDEPLNTQVIINHLVSYDYGITTASDGIEALAQLQSGKHFDLVLTDVMMPRMTGHELTERIRTQYTPNELPVIILTAKTGVDDLTQAFQAGANDYLPKPFARQELIARINTHLKLSRQHRSLRLMKERLEQLLSRQQDR